MTSAQLLALAARVEAAQGAVRELDHAIAEGIGWRFPHEGFATTPEGRSVLRSHVPRFTASLDAAASLMPEGWVWSLDSSRRFDKTPYAMAFACGPNGKDTVEHEAATPALALTTAALRALAEEIKQQTAMENHP